MTGSINKTDIVAARNQHNRTAGKLFEEMLDAACDYYSLTGDAEIEKTPEPRKVVGRTGGRKSMMICINEKKAQPEYKGTLLGGRSVVFEAKHTDTEKMEQSRVSDEQARCLDRHERLGALCFVVVSFSHEKFFRVPWGDWKCMKKMYGRKYIKADDLTGSELNISNGFLEFLEF